LRLPRLRRRPKVDRTEWPDEYVGPPNRWGLAPGPCRIERKWAGGLIIRAPGGMRCTVAKQHVIRGVENP
jgi:hypothetical protein